MDILKEQLLQVLTLVGFGIRRGPNWRRAVYFLASLGILLGTPLTTLAQVASSVLYVPIKTRVLAPGTLGHNATDYGIQVGDATTGGVQFYRASNPGSNQGYQLVLLDRRDLHLVSNTSARVTNANDVNGLLITLQNLAAPHASCLQGGCLLIIQSLGRIGYNGCGNGDYQSCYRTSATILGLGGESPVWEANADLENTPSGAPVAYSFIGVSKLPIGEPAGTFYDRLTCSLASDCTVEGWPYSLRNTAPANATADQIGNISGALVRGASGRFSFVNVQPRMPFSSLAQATTGPGKNLITTGSVENESSSLPAGSSGGFHLVVIDANPTGDAPVTVFNQTYTIQYVNPASLPSNVENLESLPNDIQRLRSGSRLFFLASIGSVAHSGAYGSTGYSYEDIWDGVAQAVLSLGGDYRTFQQLGGTAGDDYFLVGRHEYHTFPVTEASTFISRQTLAKPPKASNTAGFLKVNHEGYYAPSEASGYAGLSPSVAGDLQAASLLPNGHFPLNGPTSPAGHRKAYAWFCALLGVTDLRAQYVNSDAPLSVYTSEITSAVWNPAQYAGTSHPQTGFSEADFAYAQQQLVKELGYVVSIEDFRTNIHSFIHSTAIIDADEFNSVQALVQSFFDIVPSASTTGGGWLSIVNDFLTVAGPVAGIASLDPATSPLAVGADSAFAIASVVINSAADETDDGSGTPWPAKEQEEITASQVASRAATEFAATLTSFDNQIQRVLSDWNRMQAEGEALATFAWSDVAADEALEPYIIAVRRQLFTSLMATNYSVLHYRYSAPDDNINDGKGFYKQDDVYHLCRLEGFTSQVGFPDSGFLPGALIDGSSAAGFPTTHRFPYDKWWDVWAIGQNGYAKDCPRTYDFRPTLKALNSSGLLAPMQTNSLNLGLYQSYLFTPSRSGIPVIDSLKKHTYWVQPVDYNNDKTLYPANGDDDNH